MYKREVEDLIMKSAKGYPALVITGPRQSGKTTLARSLFPDLPYVSLEDIDMRDLVKNDPRKFLKQYKDGAIFDEAHHAPDLFSYLQQVLDETEECGRYIITGSEHFTLGARVSQSLAGRVGLISLLPLSLKELGVQDNFNEVIFKGGYPRLYHKNLSPTTFYQDYIQTYMERDARDLAAIDDLITFKKFMKSCASRVGQVINYDSMADECSISHTLARKWMNILAAGYIIFFLPTYYKNFNKRLTKMPKLYFYDTGIVCSLLGIENHSMLEFNHFRGPLYENLVILELMKARMSRGLPDNLYFWRDRETHEVDCIAEWGGKLKAIEIKSGYTVYKESTKNLKYLASFADIAEQYIVYSGENTGTLSDVKIVPLKDVRSILDD